MTRADTDTERSMQVIIADDHELFRTGLRALVESLPGYEVVAECRTGSEALKALATADADLLVVDHDMPDGTGLDVIRELTHSGAGINTAILLLTAVQSPVIFDEAVALGVNGVVTKRGSGEELLKALAQISAGEQVISDDARLLMKQSEQLKVLTRRESEVMLLLAEGLRLDDIAERLSVSYKTVETHKTHVFQKLELHSVTELVLFARAIGLVQ